MSSRPWDCALAQPRRRDLLLLRVRKVPHTPHLRLVLPFSQLSLRRPNRRPPLLAFPSLPQLLTASQHILLRMFKIPINLGPLNRVTSTAARHQILRILLPLLRARNNKVHPHHQSILKTSPSIQPAILAAVIIPLQNRQAFLQTCRLVYQGKRRDIQRHEPPPNRKSFGQGLKWECGFPNVFFGKTIGHHSVSVKLWSAVYPERSRRAILCTLTKSGSPTPPRPARVGHSRCASCAHHPHKIGRA